MENDITMQYPETESTTLEFKQQIPNNQQITKSIVAFCNLFGGRLVLGVDDNRNIIGVPENNIDELILSLQRSIYQACTPPILPSVYARRIYDKLVIIIEVSQGMNKPYFLSAHGINEGTFIRFGASTIKANATLIQELIWQSKGFSADEIPVHFADEQSLDRDRFRNFLKEKIVNPLKTDIERQLFHYKILIDEHQRIYPTLGGVLLFSSKPQQYFTEAFIICTHFKGISGRQGIATRDCGGSLVEQINNAITFVTERLNKHFSIGAKKREQTLEIPEVALREAIINAVVHRDYHLPGPIKIAIYDDRIEIFSPGNFPGPLRSQELESGVTYIRNHVICRVLRELGYIEKLGSGFITIFQAYRERNLLLPTVYEGSGYVKCVLPRAASKITTEELQEEEKILHLFYKAEEINSQTVAEALRISRQTAARRLAELISVGKIERLGKGPSARYRKL